MTPKTLTLNNILCYEDLELDFTNFNACLIQGANGAGKSSIFDSIFWVLYGEIPRKGYTRVIRDVPTKQKLGQGRLIFDVDGVEYVVERYAGTQTGVMLWEAGAESTLRTNTLRQERIVEIIGLDDKMFLNVVYFSQGDVGKFLRATSAERIELVSKIANLEIIDKLAKSVDKDHKVYTTEYNQVTGAIQSISGVIGETDVAALKQQRTEIKQKQAKASEQLRKVTATITKLLECDELQSDVTDWNDEITRIKSNTKRHLADLADEIRGMDGYEAKIAELEQKHDQMLETVQEHGDVQQRIDSVIESQERVKKAQQKLTEQRAKLEQRRDEYIAVRDAKTGDTCTLCKSVITDSHKSNMRKRIDSINFKLSEVKEHVQKSHADMQSHDAELARLRELDQEVSMATYKASQLTNEINSMRGKLARRKQLVEKVEEIKKQAKRDIQAVQDKITDAQRKLATYAKLDLEQLPKLQKAESQLVTRVSQGHTDLGVINTRIDQYYENKKRLDEAEGKATEIHEKLSTAQWWKDELPKVKVDIIATVIPFIESRANQYLERLLPNHSLKMVADSSKASNKLDIVITDDRYGVKRPVEGWSGGQGARMSLAVYMALNKLSSLRATKPIDFIMLDEKLAAIDGVARQDIIEAMIEEYSDRKIMVISHTEGNDQMFDRIIQVENNNGIGSTQILH